MFKFENIKIFKFINVEIFKFKFFKYLKNLKFYRYNLKFKNWIFKIPVAKLILNFFHINLKKFLTFY